MQPEIGSNKKGVGLCILDIMCSGSWCVCVAGGGGVHVKLKAYIVMALPISLAPFMSGRVVYKSY